MGLSRRDGTPESLAPLPSGGRIVRVDPERPARAGLTMPDVSPPTATLFLILVPLLAVSVGQRLYLHLVNPDADVFIAGYNVHHLYSGTLLVIPAAFVLAFGFQAPWLRASALVALGAGSAMVLDQVVYLVTTDGTNASYLTPISLWGAVVLEGLAVALLLVLYAIA
jgi:hypothetical protein